MNGEKSRLVLDLEPEVRERLQEIADERGVSLHELCLSAIDDALFDHGIGVAGGERIHYDIEGLTALRRQILGDRVLSTDSAETIRVAREERDKQLGSI